MDERTPLTYADAGVSLAAADESVAQLRDVLRRPQRPEVLGSIGGFGGLFALDTSRYRQPVLVSGTDGVGTKVDLARRLGILDTVGQDLVAMVVDDLVVTGAEPLFFNDYVSVGRLVPERVSAIVRGIADACDAAGCALVGGETAEHPGLLDDDEFDLAGFGVGIVERDAILGADRVVRGDAVVAFASSGVHANGFSLVRRVLGDRDLAEVPDGWDRSLGAELLTPTAIYAPTCLRAARSLDVHAFAHVTGGGIPGNLVRVLPDGLAAEVDTRTWEWPAVFRWLASEGPVAADEMWRSFNCGIGMLAVLPGAQVADLVQLAAEHGIAAWPTGRVVAGQGVALRDAGVG